MKLRILTLTSCLALAGCEHTGFPSAADTVWDQPGGPSVSLDQDRKICRFEAAKTPGANPPVPGSEVLSALASGPGQNSLKFEEMYKLCMEARGYTMQKRG
jgi:hypothetical protein